MVHMRLAMPGPWKHLNTGAYYLRQRVPSDLTKKAKGKLIAVPGNGTPKTVKIGDGVIGWIAGDFAWGHGG
jgi:hypothetical protein